MSSNGPPRNCCKVPNKHLIGHMLEGQNGRFTTGKLSQRSLNLSTMKNMTIKSSINIGLEIRNQTCDINVPRSIPINEEVDANLKNQGIFHSMSLFPRSKHLRMVESSQRGGGQESSLQFLKRLKNNTKALTPKRVYVSFFVSLSNLSLAWAWVTYSAHLGLN